MMNNNILTKKVIKMCHDTIMREERNNDGEKIRK